MTARDEMNLHIILRVRMDKLIACCRTRSVLTYERQCHTSNREICSIVKFRGRDDVQEMDSNSRLEI